MTVHRLPLRFRLFVLPGQKLETKVGAAVDLQESRSMVIARRGLTKQFEDFTELREQPF